MTFAFAIIRDLREPLQGSVVIFAAATQGVALGRRTEKRNERRRCSRMTFAIIRDIREPLQGSVVIVDVVTQGVALG